ncbi:type II secretion system F family protein [Candidatus Sumerlaeota bacterium]|nr:type II secretion system F family protein [Candidatus Sumerlaeota bacterium]
MSIPGDLWRLATGRKHLPQSMRQRLRWGAYARRTAVGELFAQLALASEERANLLESLRLTATSPVRPISSLPVTIVGSLFVCAALLVTLLAMPGPLIIGAFVPAVIFVAVLRGAAADTANLHRVSLVESELAQMLAERISEGQTLSQAMEGLPRVFTPAQVSTVRAGEEVGSLAPALRCLTREAEVRQAAGVLNFYRFYPIWALMIILGLAGFIFWRIYPKFIDIYAQMGAELPRVSLVAYQMMQARVGGFDVGLGFVLLVLLVCLYADHLVRLHLGGFASGVICTFLLLRLIGPGIHHGGIGQWFGSRNEGLGELISWGFLICLGFLMPLISDLIRGCVALTSGGVARLLPWWRRRRCALERANFLEALGLMFERRLPAPEALRLAAPALAPAGLAHAAERAAASVERGESLTEVLARLRLVMPSEEVHLRLAAAAGDLPAECRRLSERLAEEARIQIAQTEKILRPVSVLAIAALAFGVLLAIYLPLFHISSIVMGN